MKTVTREKAVLSIVCTGCGQTRHQVSYRPVRRPPSRRQLYVGYAGDCERCGGEEDLTTTWGLLIPLDERREP